MYDSPWIWTIGGTDPTCSAGVFSDIRSIDALGFKPVSVVTAVTAQNLSEASHCFHPDKDLILAQIHSLSKEFPPGAIKLSLPGKDTTIDSLFEAIRAFDCPVVWDPVLRTSSGLKLMSVEAMAQVQEKYAKIVTLVTPNLEEASIMTGIKVASDEDMVRAAEALKYQGFSNVLIKGGHLKCNEKKDLLLTHSGRILWLEQPDLSKQVHGTGCLYSSGIVCFLQKYESIVDAVIMANALVHQGILDSVSVHKQSPQRLMAFQYDPHLLSLPGVYDPQLPGRMNFPELPSDCKGLYPISDKADDLELAWKAGARYGQIRIKDLSGEELMSELRRAIFQARNYGASLFINDYWELAIELGADGVHLGSEDILGADLSRIKESELLLGISTHSLEEAAIANALNPSYISLGPVFETSCKKMIFTPRGYEMIQDWKAFFNRHLVVVGGLKSSMKNRLRSCGADGYGVISDIYSSSDPGDQVKKWLNQ